MNDSAETPAPILLASRLADTARLHAWLDHRLAGTADETAHAIRLCLEEAVMNVILHGYGPDGPGTIEVALAAEPSALIARVSDSAPAFDPTKARPAPRPPGLHAGPLGGRGLHLIRRYASSCQYERGAGHNVLTMRFGRLPPPAASGIVQRNES